MPQSPSHTSVNRDQLWLLADNASVSLGAHFREIALGLFLTHLNSSPKTYAGYFLLGSLPGLFMPYLYKKIGRMYSAKSVMAFTYVIRLIAAMSLWRVNHFILAMALLFVFSVNRSLYQAAHASYLAQSHDTTSTRHLISWLRQTESLIDLFGPLFAGWLLWLWGYRQGFLINAAFYLIALFFVGQLSRISSSTNNSLKAQEPIAPRLGMPLFVILGVSFLVWIGNVMSMAYLFHILHKGPLSYGLIMTLWGGSGIFSGLFLRRIPHSGLPRFLAMWFAVLAVAWFMISHDIGYALFCGATVLIGMGWWIIQDSLTTMVLTSQSGLSAALSRTRLQAFDEMGSILGMLVIVLFPSRALHIQLIFHILALCAFVLAGALLIYAVIIPRHGPSPDLGH
ncbi:MFS transporter [Sulfobacillus thermosulfidooxidans]|uniref:MFS transporter n=1 Tax=Sulfobacillus thermosulfidooxidans TaxID=28034 RepID=UPI0006B51D20|nr:MFS transporter [Sulfobacillus thermosulfidooxidans]